MQRGARDAGERKATRKTRAAERSEESARPHEVANEAECFGHSVDLAAKRQDCAREVHQWDYGTIVKPGPLWNRRARACRWCAVVQVEKVA